MSVLVSDTDTDKPFLRGVCATEIITIDFPHTYLVIFPQLCNLILIIIHARPTYELLDLSGFINQFIGKLLNYFDIVS